VDLATIQLHFSFYEFVIAIIAMIVVSMAAKKTAEKILYEVRTGWYISQQTLFQIIIRQH
jgi:hypothetical protein